MSKTVDICLWNIIIVLKELRPEVGIVEMWMMRIIDVGKVGPCRGFLVKIRGGIAAVPEHVAIA